MKILIVEDDTALNESLNYNLKISGYDTTTTFTKEDCLTALKYNVYDLVILDVWLPDGNGFSICSEIKKICPNTIVFFLTANDLECDVLKGYDLGGDDYITKPFSINVLKKKIEVLASRKQYDLSIDCYNDGTLEINFSDMTIKVNEIVASLTTMECRLLQVLIENPNKVLTRKSLLERLWDKNGSFVEEHALTTAISRLRNKMAIDGDIYIKTVYGMGYMWLGGNKK